MRLIVVSVLHIGPNLTHWRGTRSGGMLEIWRGHSLRWTHGHSRGAHAGANDWHSRYSRLWRGATPQWRWILRWGARRVSPRGSWRTFSSPILKQLAPYLLLYKKILYRKMVTLETSQTGGGSSIAGSQEGEIGLVPTLQYYIILSTYT